MRFLREKAAKLIGQPLTENQAMWIASLPYIGVMLILIMLMMAYACYRLGYVTALIQ